VDIQICLALSGRPSELQDVGPELEDVRGAGLGSAAPVVAPLEPADGESAYWPNQSVLPLARPRVIARALRAPELAPAAAFAAPEGVAPAALPSAAPAAPSAGGRPTAPRQGRGRLLATLAALAATLLAGSTQLRVRAPIQAAGAMHAAATVQPAASTQPGSLLQVLVQPGDSVAEHQIVAQLATAPFEAELNVRWQAFLELQGELSALEPPRPSPTQLVRAAWALVEAQSALAAASVRAPCHGRVEALAAQPGSAVVAGQPLLLIAPVGVARTVVAFLPAEERRFVMPGARVAVQLPAGSGQSPFTAQALITQIAPDIATPEELRDVPQRAPGAFVRVQLELQDAAPGLVDQLHFGEPVSVRLPGRERRMLSVLLDSVRTLLS
jgi:multidrug resistance efflux pump